MGMEEFFYPSADGTHQVHAVVWLPEGEIRGVVQLVHGICEYIQRYAPFAEFLTAHGFAVCGNDHLGHGKTAKGPEEYGFFTDWTCLVKDVHTLRERMGERFPAVPYFLLGHSMGSFVARTYLIDYPRYPDGLHPLGYRPRERRHRGCGQAAHRPGGSPQGEQALLRAVHRGV